MLFCSRLFKYLSIVLLIFAYAQTINAKTIDAGSGYLCQMEPVAHYGIREGEVIENISIKWTNGMVETYKVEKTNQTYVYKQGI